MITRLSLTALWIGLVFGFTPSSHGAIVCTGGPPRPATVTAPNATISVLSTNGTPLVFALSSPVGDSTRLSLGFSGTAINGVDVEMVPSSVIMPAGQTSVSLTVRPRAGAAFAGTRTFTVTITNSDNVCVLIGSPNSATISITGTNVASLTLPLALDATDLTWTTGGNAPWAPQTAVNHDGVDAAQSGLIADNQESWLQTTVEGPGTLKFWWKVSSEMNFDYLRFHLDGLLQQEISGEVNWQQRTYNLAAGPHTLRWQYIRDPQDVSGQNRGWVDEVSWTSTSGPPAIVTQPVTVTAWEGANVTLSAVALGSVPLTHQWVRNGTQVVSEATGPTLLLPGIVPAQTGRYQLVVSNALGMATSSVATVSITNYSPVTTALLYVEGSIASAYEIALLNLGIPYQKYPDEFTFNNAVASANRATTLAVVDAVQSPFNTFPTLVTHINAGGRALLAAYALAGNSSLATAFKVSIARRNTASLPVYDWGESPVFAGLSNLLGRSDFGFTEDGQRFLVLPGGYGVGGYLAHASPGEAAVVIGNSGRTIINGFYLQEVQPGPEAIQFAMNEILFLNSPVSATVPLIKVPPPNVQVVPGAHAVLRVVTWGGSPLSYQWYKDNQLVEGATSSTYALDGVQAAQAGSYSVVVSNSYGVAASSTVLTVTTNGAVAHLLYFADDPSTSPYPGAVISLRASYEVLPQTFTDESAFNAAVGQAQPLDTLVVIETPLSDHAFQTLVPFLRAGGRVLIQHWNWSPLGDLLTNLNATVSQDFTIPPPVYNWGAPALFSGLSSPLSLAERYLRDGYRLQPLAGGQALAGFVATPNTANQAALVLGNSGRTLLSGLFTGEITPLSSGVHFAENELRLFISSSPPVIARQPQDQAVRAGLAVSLSAAAAGSVPLTYQWYKDGVGINGATSSTYSIPAFQTNDAGGYSVVVQNTLGAVTSRVATLTLLLPPRGIDPATPLLLKVVSGQDVTFSVHTSGTLPISYRWRRGSDFLTNEYPSFSHESFYTLRNVQPGNPNITVALTNFANVSTPLLYPVAFLEIVVDTDGDGIPDEWETSQGLDPNNSADANDDSDGDTFTNYREYVAGTDAQNPDSYLRIERIAATGNVTLWFPAIAQKTYTVQYSDALSSGLWSKLVDVAARSTDYVAQVTDANPTANRYYRLVTPRQL